MSVYISGRMRPARPKGAGAHLTSATLAIVIWSTSFVGTKLAYGSFSPITLGAARFAIATVILGIVLIVKREFARPARRDMGLLALSGLMGITAYFTMENIGVKLTSAANAALIVSAYPAITAALELALYRVKISWAMAAGIALAMLGVFIITQDGKGQPAGQLAGNLILIAAGVVWAFYNFTTKKVVKKYPMSTVSFYQTLAGTLAFLPLTLLERGQWKTPQLQPALALLYLGVFCSVVAFMLYNRGLRGLSSGTAVTLMNLVPVLGVILSALLLRETVQPNQLIGGVIVILGVVLSVRRAESEGAEAVS